MSKGVIRDGLDNAGGEIGSTPNLNLICKVEGINMAVLGEFVGPHQHGISTITSFMSEASTFCFANGIPICVVGNRAECLHPAGPGSRFCFITEN